jgi:hypothetical protein
MVGIYQGMLGRGNVPENRGAGSGQIDLTFAGKPMRDTVMFVDLNSGVGPGLDGLAANGPALNPSYLSGSGNLAVREAWVEMHTPRKNLGLQVGVIDLSGAFDANSVANDETGQFLTGSLVNSPLLQAPANSPGAILRADFNRWSLKLGAQDSRSAGGDDLVDSLYGIAELGFRYNFHGDAVWRVWARQQPRGTEQPDQALGLSVDHRVTPRLTTFWRYAKNSYQEDATGAAINGFDWAASGGLELGNFAARRLKDRLGVGYGRDVSQGGSQEEFAELYYKLALTSGFSLSLHGQGIFNRVRSGPGVDAAAPIFALGVRTQMAY